tara:strand:- start:629 stop:832 length:204 start_codon:yes stop_codon:yes gene_type:complete
MGLNLSPQQTLTLECTECGQPLPEIDRRHAIDRDFVEAKCGFQTPPTDVWYVWCKKCGQPIVKEKKE